MKQITSKKPGKQRKYRLQAPLHRRREMVSSTLSEELKKKYKRRSMSVRKGDKVRVMRGEFRGTQGDVMRVNTKEYKIYVGGITIKKSDGTEIERAIDPSNVMLVDLFLEDKKRREILERKMG
ncbi:MAG: 50S ribosomal protein L24 [Candidatus Altiarchaeota archaeon]|nr:50S ribosomal protein L24 [Candidatus Altiarchaeota archaeon]